MNIYGIVAGIKASGYDRILTIQLNGRTVWCSYFKPSEYVESGRSSELLGSGTSVRLKIFLTMVLKSEVIGDKGDRSMTQNIPNSPHVVAFGRVEDKLASDAYLVSVGEVDPIEVQFEQDVKLNVGAYIRIEGELTAVDDIDE